MNKKIAGIVAGAAILVVGAACFFTFNSKKTEVENTAAVVKEISHVSGTTKLQGVPERVVALDYGTVDALDAMEVELVGLPKSGKLPSYLDKFKDEKYGNTGSVKEPDLEAINALKPDVIFISGRMTDYYDKLSEIAPTININIDGAAYIESFTNAMNIYGEIFDKTDKVDSLVNNVKTKAEEVKAKTTGLTANTIMINGRSLSAFGPDSRYGLLFNELGFNPADSNLTASTHGQEVSFEYLVEHPSDYIFVVDRNAITGGKDSAKDILNNELVNETKAAKDGNIVYLDSVIWYTVSGGYTSTLDMISEVNRALK
ncbi:iron complex transport system substrate-binding protein [Clostridium sp. DSM 8431]|uniref:siderophore ABC transporter substrate-binding protein n=1 Tax=Clostridium sp. DSM 8431 TaxID=1761781 RepID=UPI0008EC5136|nr:ABC transporter substrate-binding protein [Clostridium sp. DSM 8431]SFU77176.1 iron complex transport system substrate-binding protein [Clostridium sp. DSM 8431]